MAREARSPFVILGMLTLGPMTGYELRLRIEQTIGHFWQESFGQLYPALTRLEADGLVTLREDARGERVRNVYRITRKGRARLRSWLEKSPPHHVERNELLLKLFFASEGDPSAPIAHVKASREDAAERLSTLRDVGKALAQNLGDHPAFDYYWAGLRCGELGLEAHLRWCDEVLARLERRQQNA